MAALVYPDSLPCPQRAPYDRAERRALSGIPGKRRSRTLWRDRLASEQVQFLLTFEETLIWRNWFDNEQLNGGAWFSASWRLPSGRNGVYRFVEAPSYPEFVAAVGWRVRAVLEVRGRGMAPQSHSEFVFDGVLLHFDGSTQDYGVHDIVATSSSGVFEPGKFDEAIKQEVVSVPALVLDSMWLTPYVDGSIDRSKMTIEFFVKAQALANQTSELLKITFPDASVAGIIAASPSLGLWDFHTSDLVSQGNIDGLPASNSNTWVHVAIQMSSEYAEIMVDGELVFMPYLLTAFSFTPGQSTQIRLGALDAGLAPWNMFFDELRITLGPEFVYITPFIPPSSPFPPP